MSKRDVAETPYGMKWCQKHNDGRGSYLPLSNFTRNRTKPDGRNTYCRFCHNGYLRRLRAAKKEGMTPIRTESREVVEGGSYLCARCKQMLPIDAFTCHRRNGRYLVRSYCRSCQNSYARANYRKHAEVYSERKKLDRRARKLLSRINEEKESIERTVHHLLEA